MAKKRNCQNAGMEPELSLHIPYFQVFRNVALRRIQLQLV